MSVCTTTLVFLSCFLSATLICAQTGVTVVGDVYIAPAAEVGIHTDELTLEASIQGDGDVIMASRKPQKINARGHCIPRLTVDNPKGVELISDLEITVALSVPQGELRLHDALLIVPTDIVIKPIEYSKIHPVGRGRLVIKSHIDPITHTGSPTSRSQVGWNATLTSSYRWQLVVCRFIPCAFGRVQTVFLNTARQVPSPPPKVLSLSATNSYILPIA